jgi:hypothetical protein
MSTEPPVPSDDGAPDADAAYCATLDAVGEVLREQARSWAAQLRLVAQLDTLSRRARHGTAQFVQLEMAGSWQIGQLTATRWQWESERMHEALPLTLDMLERGDLLVHQATVLLQRTRHCTPEVARAVEASVLPAGAELIPADLTRRVDRAVLQVESEQPIRLRPSSGTRRLQPSATRSPSRCRTAWGLAGAVLTASSSPPGSRASTSSSGASAVPTANRGWSARQSSAAPTCSPPCPRWSWPAPPRTGRAPHRQPRGRERPVPVDPRPEQLAAQVVLNVHAPCRPCSTWAARPAPSTATDR